MGKPNSYKKNLPHGGSSLAGDRIRARLYLGKSEDSRRAKDLLRDAGYSVISFETTSSLGPELKIGRNVYYGLSEIEKLLSQQD